MKNINLLIWLTQLGLSVAVPLGGFILLAVWLHRQFEWGSWVIWVGAVLGVIVAVDGLRSSIKAMLLMSKDKDSPDPPVSFNDHI